MTLQPSANMSKSGTSLPRILTPQIPAGAFTHSLRSSSCPWLHDVARVGGVRIKQIAPLRDATVPTGADRLVLTMSILSRGILACILAPRRALSTEEQADSR